MWAKVLIGVLGLGALAAAAASKGDDDEPPGPGPFPDGLPDVGSIPATPGQVQLDYIPATVKLKLVASKKVVTLKGVPAQIARELGELFCTGGTGVFHEMAIITSQIKVPSKVHLSWHLYGWCVATVTADNRRGIPAGVYLSVWPHNGEKLAFGPFEAYRPPTSGRYKTNVQDALKNILAVSTTKAKEWAIR